VLTDPFSTHDNAVVTISYPSATYQRLELRRPDHLPDAQWEAIAAEAGRIEGAIERGDGQQIIGATKDLIESIARAVKELNGEPAARGDSFEKLVEGAHELLRSQPGPGLDRSSDAGQLANWATKMAKKLGTIRNEHGTGHGRAAVPDTTVDTITLSVDAGLMWARWALRRLGLFCVGRPTQIISDLETGIWRQGELASRLEATNLQEEPTARAVGLAVGRRGAGDTWNVVQDGLDEPAGSADLKRWPEAYRWAAAEGHLFKASGESTVTINRLKRALALVRPVIPDSGAPLPDEHPWPQLVHRIITEHPAETVRMDIAEENGLRLAVLTLVEASGPGSPAAELLAEHFGISRVAHK
jgi:hypothetical protein